MKNKIIEGYLDSMSFCISEIKAHEENTKDVEEYLNAIQRRIDHIREELEK